MKTKDHYVLFSVQRFDEVVIPFYYNTSIIGETLGMQVYNNINNSRLSCNEPILTISIIPKWLNCSLQTNKQSQCQRCLEFQLQMEC